MITANRIQFSLADHTYLLDGQPVGSVTQILSSEGLSGDGNGYWKEEHRLRGSKVHQIALLIGTRVRGATAEEIIENSRWDPLTTHPTLVPYGYALAQWYADSGFQPVLTEQIVASARFQVAGTLDQWGLLDGLRTLVDFKSGAPTAAANLQLAVYAMLLEETLGVEYETDQRIVVQIKPDGSYKSYPPRPARGIDLGVACAAVSVYNWRKANRML